MGATAFIPGTTEWHKRRLRNAFPSLANKGDVLVEMEYPDGVVTLEPAVWDIEQEKYTTINSDLDIFCRGEGSTPKSLFGVPIIRAYAPNAGAISTEAAILADRRDNDEFVDVDEDGTPVNAPAAPDGEAAARTDGGTANAKISDRVVNFLPPDGSDAQVFSLKEASDYDPHPVTQQAVEQAVAYNEIGENQQSDKIKSILIGIAVGVGIPVALWILAWLMGQIGGSGGGGSVVGIGMVLVTSLALLAPARPDGEAGGGSL